MKNQIAILVLTINTVEVVGSQMSMALPPPEDIPEEVLRTEIILDGRSSLDGKALSASEYAELQVRLRASTLSPKLDSEIEHLIFLLQIRKLLKTFIPFLIK